MNVLIGNGKENALMSHHLKMLREESAISNDVIAARGYFSITNSAKARKLGFSNAQVREISETNPALIIPYHKPSGELATYCLRPDRPRVIENKKKGKLPDGTYPQRVIKYDMPKGAGNVVDCHPSIVSKLSDPSGPLYFTEGAKKADSLVSHGFPAVNLNGVWGWRGTNSQQGKTALADFDDIALNGREVILLFDSDIRSNDQVRSALRRLKSFLENRGAVVIPVLLPPNGPKGIDDWFAAGHTANELQQLVGFFSLFVPDLGAGGKRKMTTEKIIDWYHQSGLEFRINDMAETLELNGRRFDDTARAKLEATLTDEGISVAHGLNAAIVMGDHGRYHPIRAYLEQLKWDGTDWIGILATHFVDKEGMFQTWLKRWMIGAVAKAIGGGQHQNFMLVLATSIADRHGQGKGKSYFVRWLCPNPCFYSEAPIDPDRKDCRLNLTRYWIWEASELGSITQRRDREALKAFVSMQTVEERRPYGRENIEKPAVSSFIGTINNEHGFLNDPTGNRRYAVCTIQKIDWSYTKIDVDQLWAQAYHLYKKDEPWMLTEEEQVKRDQINAGYEQEDPLEAMVLQRFSVDPNKEDDPDWWLTTPEILEMIGQDPGNKYLAGRIGTILRQEGLEPSTPRRDIRAKTTSRNRKFRFWRGIRFNGTR